MNDIAKNSLSKVPEVTLAFWIIKILATTLGETGGDAVSMTMNFGYLVGTVIFAAIFLVAVIAQIKVSGFHPFIYWTTIIATTTVGTTLADFADRSLGIGYAGGSSLLFTLLMASLAIWYRSLGTVSVDTISSPKAEMLYWGTILFSQTLGTALGDWMADTNGLGYERGALVFTAGLALIAGGGYFYTKISRTVLFWSAFILTRPLGATLGDLLDKPVDHGGLAFGRFYASAVLAALIVAIATAVTVISSVSSLRHQDEAFGQIQTIIVARRDLPVGTRVGASDLDTRHLRGEPPARDTITRTADAVDRIVRAPILRGDLLTARHLTASRRGASASAFSATS